VKRFVIIVEKAGGNYSAYAPDLPGCAATGPSPEEARTRMQEAIALHLEGLRESNEPIPEPVTTTYTVDVA
jgi:predicted RNase H-like HicB family nuclease